MQKTLDINLSSYIKKYWFQLALIGIVLYVMTSKDLSFQFNVNNPEIENSRGIPEKAQQRDSKKSQELLTSNQTTTKVAKSEASFFSKIPFIGSGSNSRPKKSELPKIDDTIIENYIRRFAHVAINERKKYGVPSSIIIANALFHSYGGKRDIALSGNNHFAISCENSWTGPNGTYAGSCYRHYENAWTSFRDHSLFVTSGKYAQLRELESTDYKGWAKNLEAQGFSDFDDLEVNLINLIEKYSLHQLDFQ